jgi:hypothetical protein
MHVLEKRNECWQIFGFLERTTNDVSVRVGSKIQDSLRFCPSLDTCNLYMLEQKDLFNDHCHIEFSIVKYECLVISIYEQPSNFHIKLRCFVRHDIKIELGITSK